MGEAIRITGLKEYVRELRKLDADLPKTVRLVLNDAMKIVVDDAKPRVPVRTGRAAGSIRARSGQREAKVSAGGKRVPYYAWLDFGGAVGRRHHTKRPFIKQGRYIWRAYAANKKRIEAKLLDGLTKNAAEAGLDPKRGR